MRKATFVYTLLGLSIYLFGIVIGISLPHPQNDTDILIMTPIPLTPQEIIQKFEPNHTIIVEKLTRPDVFEILTVEEKVFLAREYLLIGRTVEGEKLLKSLIEKTSPSLPAVILLADHYHSLGYFEQELTTITKNPEFSKDPEIIKRLIPISVLFGSSIVRIQDLPPMKADDPLAQIINCHSIHDERQKNKLFGAQLARLSEWRLAERLLEEEYKAYPNNSELYPLLALERISMGNTIRTQNILNKIEIVGLNHYQASDQAMVAMAYKFSGNSKRAMEIFQDLTQLQPQETLWKRNFAQLTALNTPLLALEILVELSKSAPSEENLITLLNFTIDYPAYHEPYGTDAYQKLASAESPTPELLVSLARFDLARNKPEFALASLDKVISSEASTGYYKEALWLRATTNLSLENKSAAARDLLEILHFYPPSRYSSNALQLYEANHLDSFR